MNTTAVMNFLLAGNREHGQ